MNKQVYRYFMPPVSIVGVDCLDEIAEYIRPMRVRKALIISDRVLADTGLVKKLTSVLDNLNILHVLYTDVKPNPTVENVEQGLQSYRDNGCDFLVSFGGGSPHDCAKAVALLATNGGRITDYVGSNKSKHPAAPLVAVNTTAGTGSEVTRFCVITDEQRHVKMAIDDWHVTPLIAVNDAALMTGMPPGLTAATGMDALTHAIEAYVSTQATPVTDCKALKAIELVAGYLPRAFYNGNDLEARVMMTYAEYLAGISFNNASLGYVHALAHQLGGFYNLPHGLCNALLLPAVCAYNLPSAPAKFARIAEAMGAATTMLPPMEAGLAAIGAIQRLQRELKLPTRLSELKGFEERHIPTLAANAQQDVCGLTNPRRATQAELEAMLRALL
ncbi:iron-containing alcohol dehydrogenase [Heliobacterium undosum]|uniref:Iron-containing alcohol dehydrogenase n=1 Tax=Heliomicrobium undosum TaxID=121734 RepID=A0A845L599_9FIRM|nr:iron-containing alcohol dehydrogenase [Heliomicrobium undosum]MZP30024.1 iron-containing alcohol dehydrogenase [Heliomicrobium undosum]